MFGSVDSQMYMCLSGIVVDHMSDNLITVEPFFTEHINKLACNVETRYGKVMLNWEREATGLTVKVCVPSGVKSKVDLPDGFTRIEDGVWKKSF